MLSIIDDIITLYFNHDTMTQKSLHVSEGDEQNFFRGLTFRMGPTFLGGRLKIGECNKNQNGF